MNHHMIDGKKVMFTQAEQDAWDAKEVADAAEQAAKAEYLATIQYRIDRGEAYKQELGDTPGFDAAIADVLDAVIDATDAVLTATGTPVPAKFAQKKAKRDEIKARFPKP